MDVLWKIELFGGLKLIGQDRTVSRFQTYKTGALLGYLCSHAQIVPRDVLVELLWPDADLEAARNSLRVALNSLRRQIEPPSIQPGAVLMTSRSSIQLNRDVIVTDVQEFERLLQQAAHATDETQQKDFLVRAVACYQGPFLPGHYEDWVTPERLRLADAYAGALRRLTRVLVVCRDLDGALDIARRALVADPLHESSHCNLMQLYVALGKPAAAAQQYRELESLLREQLGVTPSETTHALVRKLALNLDQTPTVATPSPSPTPLSVRSEDPGVLHTASVSGPQGYVPPQMTRFFGREEELQWLIAQFQEPHTRLITLTGPGGIGKTRLAIEAAEHLRTGFAGRAWFVALAEVQDRERVLTAIASALALTRTPETDPLPQIVRALSIAPALLVLDNLEQVVEASADVVATLLTQVPGLSILASSRQTLGVAGEREMAVSVLTAPLPDEGLSGLLAIPAVQLFLDRAQAARLDFQLTPRNAATIAALVIRLEGLPLAIELAAAWAQSLTPSQMLERLNARFDLLVSSRKDRTPRQRTLRGAIDWSYHLLELPLQTLFARLSVFRDGWTLEAALAVCQEPEALTLLHELQQRSLLTSVLTQDQMRFRMLSTIRDYASERLPDANRRDLQDAHARYYFTEVQKVAQTLDHLDFGTTLRLLEAESANIDAALEWFTAHALWGEAVQMAAALWRFWYETAQVKHGRSWIERLCTEAQGMPERAGMNLFYGAGRLAASQNDLLRAEAYFEKALLLARRNENSDGQTQALSNLVLMASARADYEAVIGYLTENLRLKRANRSRWKRAYALSALAEAHLQHGDCLEAQKLFAESALIRSEIGDSRGAAEARIGLSQALKSPQLREEATRMEEEALEAIRHLAESSALTSTFLTLGTMAWEQGDFRTAATLFADGLALFEESADKAGCALALECLAEIALCRKDLSLAGDLIARSLDLHRDLEDVQGAIAALNLSGAIAMAQNDPFATTAFSREEQRLQDRHLASPSASSDPNLLRFL